MTLLISIVSHNHGNLVYNLLKDLQSFCSVVDLEVLLTLNLPGKLPFLKTDFEFKLEILQNEHPRGFATNHNRAFKRKPSDFFAVLNPDLRLIQDPFLPLISLAAGEKKGAVAPLIINADKLIEDSARRLPTPARLLKRYFWKPKHDRLDYPIEDRVISPDWIAGIFMLFRSSVFSEMNGFDERYFLYFEDVDLCSRLRLAGYQIILDPRISVVHNARRDSHRNFQYLRWHILSGMRFFSSRVFWNSWLFQFKKKIRKTL
ncbi:MAG: hypothetical protein A2Y79_09755 [Deltaproteobacteria bacterium RBG_13_43_22]|nr:MAG: hypothetical protein A2Y79_09755 [Deltaproteobacteria bacterium RBG_13_43_22]